MMHYLIIAAAYIAACILIAYLGRRRKWGYWGYLWSSLLFTPAMGFLFLLASDPAPRPRPGERGGAG